MGSHAEPLHVEPSPLASLWEKWDGEAHPADAYRALDAYLAEHRFGLAEGP